MTQRKLSNVAQICLCLCTFVGIPSIGSHGQSNHVSLQDAKEEKLLGWEALWFSEDRRITKIKIVLVDMKSSPWGKYGIAGKSGMEFETSDKLILKTMEEGLTLPMSIGIPDNSRFGGGGAAIPVGHIVVTTNKDSFFVGINSSGFVLGSKDRFHTRRAFYSWMIAKQIDDILNEKKGIRMPKASFQAISGEAKINGEKHLYELLRKPKKQRP